MEILQMLNESDCYFDFQDQCINIIIDSTTGGK